MQKTNKNTMSLKAGRKKNEYDKITEHKAERSIETKADTQISPISSFCQFEKGLAMTVGGGVTGVKTTRHRLGGDLPRGNGSRHCYSVTHNSRCQFSIY